MSDILNITEKPISDENIIKKDYQSYVPYIQSYKNNDEIRITLQNQDLYVIPSESYLYVEGSIKNVKGEKSSNARLRNNCIAFLFDEIRYEINGVEVDRTRYLGTSSTIKNYVSLNEFESNMMKNAGWCISEDLAMHTFNFYLPLKLLMGFAEDFNKIILNSKHELILLRSSSDANVYYSIDVNENLLLSITNIIWRIPHVQLSDNKKLQIMKVIKDGISLPIAFRSWDCYLNPTFSGRTNHSWNVKLALNRERPRFIICVLENNNKYIHSDLKNIKVHLNSVSYPYDDLNLKFEENRYAILYDMYAKFQQNYYIKDAQPLLSCEKFKDTPIIVVDVSYQNELIKSGPIDVKIEFETSKPVPANTNAYCLILYDRLMKYTPLTGIVEKVI